MSSSVFLLTLGNNRADRWWTVWKEPYLHVHLFQDGNSRICVILGMQFWITRVGALVLSWGAGVLHSACLSSVSSLRISGTSCLLWEPMWASFPCTCESWVPSTHFFCLHSRAPYAYCLPWDRVYYWSLTPCEKVQSFFSKSRLWIDFPVKGRTTFSEWTFFLLFTACLFWNGEVYRLSPCCLCQPLCMELQWGSFFLIVLPPQTGGLSMCLWSLRSSDYWSNYRAPGARFLRPV